MNMYLAPGPNAVAYGEDGSEIDLARHRGARVRNPQRSAAGSFTGCTLPVPKSAVGVALMLERQQKRGRHRWLRIWIPEATYKTCIYKEFSDGTGIGNPIRRSSGDGD